MADPELLDNNQLQHDKGERVNDLMGTEVLLSEISIDSKDEFPEPDESSNEVPPSALSTTAVLAKQAWAWACWSGERTWDGLDFAGEVVANFLGLTRSKYQWMLDIQAREEDERRLRRLEARQRRQLRLEQLLEQEKRKLDELEAGYDVDNQDERDAGCENNQELESVVRR
ncbi:hypothetical protein PybrP1_005910 [[Pythium] brassicae (nom. inval.)]|nr:hypothetical protein PybrP1_005910 [[Pythium] brassicae (nom. inval.)]